MPLQYSDLHCACGRPGPIGARPSTDSMLITIWILFRHGFGNHCISCIFHAYDYGLQCACRWPGPWGPSHPQTLNCSSVLLCQDYSIHSILIFILVPVSYMWIWSSLCLWIFWPRRCQAIRRSGADHPTWFDLWRSQHSICTLMITIIRVSCIWIWFSLCLWMSWSRWCQALHRLRSDHITDYCLSRFQYPHILWKLL